MLEKFKEVFSNIEINEDQAQALNSFFEEYSRSLEKKFKVKCIKINLRILLLYSKFNIRLKFYVFKNYLKKF